MDRLKKDCQEYATCSKCQTNSLRILYDLRAGKTLLGCKKCPAVLGACRRCNELFDAGRALGMRTGAGAAILHTGAEGRAVACGRCGWVHDAEAQPWTAHTHAEAITGELALALCWWSGPRECRRSLAALVSSAQHALGHKQGAAAKVACRVSRVEAPQMLVLARHDLRTLANQLRLFALARQHVSRGAGHSLTQNITLTVPPALAAAVLVPKAAARCTSRSDGQALLDELRQKCRGAAAPADGRLDDTRPWSAAHALLFEHVAQVLTSG